MKRAALSFSAIGAVALLPAIGAQAAATSCSDALHQLAQTYHLSLAPSATAQAGNSAEQRGTAGSTAEAPATTESRGMAAAPDSLESSGGTLPPATSSGAHDRQGGAAAADQLGPADRAKAEGMLSEAQAADAQGKGDQCLQFLRAAQAMLKGRQ